MAQGNVKITDITLHTEIKLILEADRKHTGSRLEAHWDKTGSRLEADWKSNTSALAVHWERTGS